ncbi:DUF4126 family protein [Pseudoxanthomonas dokdonensis]|uniref:Membrane protein n=1 Tax=Pseudoxanthomonas dokdonensis TaxID=344882 RepID=A0A0R0CLF8_9GAMM|nr:DUF4126 family protein [Pseudoxanthomonas dokdonensis]KRG70517.1 membrane protein [Pseudoxanthomonas dokdonensis]
MALLHSILMGAVAGMRALTPLAAVSQAACSGRLPADNGAPRLLRNHQLVRVAMLTLAGGELLGDKMKAAPNRIASAGLLARAASGSMAGAALAPRQSRHIGALLGAGSAIAAAYLSFHLRRRALEHFGQASAGVVEDAIAVGSAALIASRQR